MQPCSQAHTPTYDELLDAVRVLAQVVHAEYPEGFSLHEIVTTWTPWPYPSREAMVALKHVEDAYLSSTNSSSASSTMDSR